MLNKAATQNPLIVLRARDPYGPTTERSAYGTNGATVTNSPVAGQPNPVTKLGFPLSESGWILLVTMQNGGAELTLRSTTGFLPVQIGKIDHDFILHVTLDGYFYMGGEVSPNSSFCFQEEVLFKIIDLVTRACTDRKVSVKATPGASWPGWKSIFDCVRELVVIESVMGL